MKYDPTERIMNVFGIEGFWNLVWIIPLAVLIGIFIAAYWPYGKGPEGPPYVGFDPGENYTGRHRFEDRPKDQYDFGGDEWRGDGCKGRPYVPPRLP